MAYFDWNNAIPGVTEAWRKTEGKNVKIAIIDSGAQLHASALRHLDRPGHKFNLAQPGFSLSNALLPGGGNDAVTDQLSFGEMHGTATLSVLAGKPDSAGNGIKGVAPEAEVFIMKIMEPSAMYRKGYILDAIELALKLKVDIITCSVLPTFAGTYTEGRKDVLFKALRESNTLFISTLTNTTLPSVLTQLKFPSDQPECIVTGVAQIPVLSARLSAADLYKGIHFLSPPAKISALRMQSPDTFPLFNASGSVMTAALAGVCALLLSHRQRRLTKSEVLAELNQYMTLSYDPMQMMGDTLPAFYANKINT